MIGKTISHYKIIEKLGSGGMGVVYKVKDLTLNRFVALKFLPPHVSADEEEKQRFIHEAKAAAALEHSNICNIYEIDATEDDQMFIAMAYYEGETLKKKIEKGPLKLDEALDITIQVAQGLNEAHSNDIVHRDIKPANIFITSKNVVKILDFGLAKLAGQSKLTKAGSTLGTVGYMSPEQAKGEESDHRADIWSLGVVLYEMITGVKPFKGDYDQSVMYAIMNEKHDPITGLRTGVPMELERIVNKNLKKNPAERYQAVGDMLVDLKSLMKDLEPTIKLRPAGVRETEGRKNWFRRVSISVVAGLILVLAFFMFRSFISEEVLGSAPVPIAVISFENQTGDASYDRLQKVIPNLLITSLEQSKYLRVTTWQRMHDLLKQAGKQDVEIIDEDLGFELCSMDGVDAIVLGSITKLGDVFVTDVKVLDVQTKEILKSAQSQGEGEESIIKKQIDALSREIVKGIGLSERKAEAAFQQSICDVTTSSIDAYNYYVRGVDEVIRYKWFEASKFLEKAIQLDSTFAAAYLDLALIHDVVGNTKAANEASEKAKRYSEKATEKERLFIEAWYTGVIERNPEKGIRIFKEIIKKYPKEKRAYYYLGHYYGSKELNHKAIEEWKKALDLDPQYGSALNMLAYGYSSMGELDLALEYLKRYAFVSPGDPNPFDSMADIYFLMGKLDEAIMKFKDAIEVDPDWFAGRKLDYIYALKEDYIEAMKWTDQYIAGRQLIGEKADGYMRKGFFHYWLGGLERSLDEFRRAKDLCKTVENKERIAFIDRLIGWIYYEKGEFDVSRRYMKKAFDFYFEAYPENMALITAITCCDLGLVDLKEGRIDSARNRLNEMNSMLTEVSIQKERIKFRHDLYHGMVLLKENSIRDAIAVCEKASSSGMSSGPGSYQIIFDNVPVLKDLLAQAYYMNRELDKAIAEYERLTIFNPNQKDRLLIHPKYHYRLAQLYEEKDWPGKAIEQYEKFLDIWKDADEDLPELIDARARLAKLKR